MDLFAGVISLPPPLANLIFHTQGVLAAKADSGKNVPKEGPSVQDLHKRNSKERSR